MYTKVKSDPFALLGLQARGVTFLSLMTLVVIGTLAVGTIASIMSGVPVVVTP